MKAFFQRIWTSILPVVGMTIFVILFIIGLFVFSYLLIIGAVVGLILFIIAFIRIKLRHRKPSTSGRLIEHDSER